MKLAPLLSVETIAMRLTSTDRRGVLAELASLMVQSGTVPEKTDLVTILENREELGSTGIGGGGAIPHVRLRNLNGLHIGVGFSAGGVDFQAIDGKPVHIFFLLLAPENSTGEHLKALARISRLLKKPHFKSALEGAADREEMLRIIVSEDEKD